MNSIVEAKYDKQEDVIFNVLSELYENTDGINSVTIRCATSKDKSLDPYTQNLVDNKLIQLPTLKEKSGYTEVTITTIEPAYTYYSYHNMGKLNIDSYINHLGDLIQSAPIDSDRVYSCSLSVDDERYVYLNWDNSRLKIHDLGNKKSSTRRRVVNYLISQGRTVTFRQIRDSLGATDIGDGYKSIKDVLSTSFMQYTLRRHFQLSRGKASIGIKHAALIQGSELIRIIREQLHRIERSDKSNFNRKISAINIDFALLPKNRQDP